MNKELYKLLMEYRGRELDDDFIDSAVDTIMCNEDESLYPYVFGHIIDNDNKHYGTYDHHKKLITINREKITHDGPCRRGYNDKIYALEVIRHEIEHARNIERLHQFRNDIESTIIRYSLIDYCMQSGLMPFPVDKSIESLIRILKKEQNYLYNPEERMTDIKAWKFMVNLLKNQRTSDDLLFARSMLFYAYRRGYEDNRYYIDPPTYTYLLNTDMLREHYLLKKRVDKKDYSFDTRLMYGLPITNEEYEHKILRKVKLQIRKDKDIERG